MKQSLIRLLTLLLLLSWLPPAAAEVRWGQHPIVDTVPTPSPPSIGAPSHILVDMRSGYVLAERSPRESWEPASLAKMMTAYVVFEELSAGHIDLEDSVTVSETAWRSTGSRMFLEAGSEVTVAELLQGLIVQSGNDAAVALAEHVAGDEDTFAQVMNQHADRLGMEDTRYTNATGMPDDEMRTTALDTARLARAIIDDFPEFYDWYSQRSFEYGGIRQHNRNRLLWRDETVDGLKTGHTRSAGYNLTTSAERGNMRLISVVLGTEGEDARAQQSLQLLNYGFRFFESHRLYSAGDELAASRAWLGDTDSVSLTIEDDLYVTIPRRERDNLSASMSVDGQIKAPIEAGDQLGTLKIELAGGTVHEAPLVATHAVEEGGLWRRLTDQVMLRFQ